MSSMPQARIHAPNDIRLDQVRRPTPGPGDVLVQVAHCGICGSDLSYAKLGGLPGAASPFALGHEFSGVVAEVGEKVSHVSVGDRVVINPEEGDNTIGSDGIEGAFAPFTVYHNAVDHPEGVLKLPAELDYELGALIEPLSVGMHAVNQAGVSPGDKVAVFGGGPVGLAAAIAADYLGAGKVVVVDLSEKRLSVARELGLITFNPDRGEIREFLTAEHGIVTNDPLLGEQPGTDIYIEATGVGSVFQQLTQTARKGARITVVAVHFAPVELDMLNLLLKELVISAAIRYPSEFPAVIEMLQSGRVDVSPMISHRFPLSRFDEAFAQAQRPDEALKVLVDCQA